MDLETIRAYCLGLPHVTEQIQWGNDLLFKIGGKMFAVTPLVPSKVMLSLKCTPEEFAELIERPNIIPAPYMARMKWVGLETLEALPKRDIERLLSTSYQLVKAKLPKKAQADLATTPKRAVKKPAKKK